MLVTHELMQTIEDAIAAERSAFADGMAALRPASGASWCPVAGGGAIFTGADYFGNRAMALGLRGPVSPADLDCLEDFYAQHGVPSVIELASMADRSLIRLLNQRGYVPVRFRNIYAQALSSRHDVATEATTPSRTVEIQTVCASNAPAWSMTLLDGFGYTSDADRTGVECWNQMVCTLPGVTARLAVLDGKPVGAASMMVLGATALLGCVERCPPSVKLEWHGLEALTTAGVSTATPRPPPACPMTQDALTAQSSVYSASWQSRSLR